MTIHFLCISWCLTGGNKGRGAWSDITRRGGDALPSILLVPFPPGGPFPRPPRQQHSKDRRKPPPPLDFLLPNGVEPETGVPSSLFCCPPGEDPITNNSAKLDTALKEVHSHSGCAVKDKFSRLLVRMISLPHVWNVYFSVVLTIKIIRVYTDHNFLTLEPLVVHLYVSLKGNTTRSNFMAVGNRCSWV